MTRQEAAGRLAREIVKAWDAELTPPAGGRAVDDRQARIAAETALRLLDAKLSSANACLYCGHACSHYTPPGSGGGRFPLEALTCAACPAGVCRADRDDTGRSPGEKAAAMAGRAHEEHRAHASTRPVDGCVWCDAEEIDRRG